MQKKRYYSIFLKLCIILSFQCIEAQIITEEELSHFNISCKLIMHVIGYHIEPYFILSETSHITELSIQKITVYDIFTVEKRVVSKDVIDFIRRIPDAFNNLCIPHVLKARFGAAAGNLSPVGEFGAYYNWLCSNHGLKADEEKIRRHFKLFLIDICAPYIEDYAASRNDVLEGIEIFKKRWEATIKHYSEKDPPTYYLLHNYYSNTLRPMLDTYDQESHEDSLKKIKIQYTTAQTAFMKEDKFLLTSVKNEKLPLPELFPLPFNLPFMQSTASCAFSFKDVEEKIYRIMQDTNGFADNVNDVARTPNSSISFDTCAENAEYPARMPSPSIPFDSLKHFWNKKAGAVKHFWSKQASSEQSPCHSSKKHIKIEVLKQEHPNLSRKTYKTCDQLIQEYSIINRKIAKTHDELESVTNRFNNLLHEYNSNERVSCVLPTNYIAAMDQNLTSNKNIKKMPQSLHELQEKLDSHYNQLLTHSTNSNDSNSSHPSQPFSSRTPSPKTPTKRSHSSMESLNESVSHMSISTPSAKRRKITTPTNISGYDSKYNSTKETRLKRFSKLVKYKSKEPLEIHSPPSLHLRRKVFYPKEYHYESPKLAPRHAHIVHPSAMEYSDYEPRLYRSPALSDISSTLATEQNHPQSQYPQSEQTQDPAHTPTPFQPSQSAP